MRDGPREGHSCQDERVRSVNTAYKVGREIGREVDDVWIPDEVLYLQVRRSIGPRIKLFRSDEDKNRDNWSGVFRLSTVPVMVAIAGVLIVVLPFELPGAQNHLTSFRAWAVTLPHLYLIGVGALLVLMALACGLAWRRARDEAARVYDASVRSLYAAAFQGATEVLETRRRKVGMAIERTQHRTFPPPSPRPAGVDARGAEEVVAQWMRHLGEVDAELTSYTGDGGVDVQGRKSFAQVKHYATAVGVAPIRELAGVAASDPRRRQALFFTRTGYAQGAVDFADSVGIALFTYDAERAGLEALNARAKTLLHNGI